MRPLADENRLPAGAVRAERAKAPDTSADFAAGAVVGGDDLADDQVLARQAGVDGAVRSGHGKTGGAHDGQRQRKRFA